MPWPGTNRRIRTKRTNGCHQNTHGHPLRVPRVRFRGTNVDAFSLPKEVKSYKANKSEDGKAAHKEKPSALVFMNHG